MKKNIQVRYIPEPNEIIHGAKLLGKVSDKGEFLTSYTANGKQVKEWLPGHVVAEIAQATGIEKGGRIPAPLIWVTRSTMLNMFLIRVGSEEYERLKAGDEVRSKRIVKNKDLIEGGVYMSINGTKGVYLGRVNTVNIGIDHFGSGSINANGFCTLLKWSILDDRMLWCESPPSTYFDSLTQASNFQAWLHETLSLHHPNVWSELRPLHFKNSHSYRVLLATVESDLDKMLPMLQELLFKWLEAAPTAFNICRVSDLLNATTGEPIIDQRVLELIDRTGHVIIPPGTKAEQLPEFLAHPDQAVRAEATRILEGRL